MTVETASPMKSAMRALEFAFGTQHPVFTREDHKLELECGDSRLVEYWEWLVHQIEADGQDVDRVVAASQSGFTASGTHSAGKDQGEAAGAADGTAGVSAQIATDRLKWLEKRLQQIKPSARADVELIGRVLHEQGPVAAGRSLSMVVWLNDAVVWEASAIKEMAVLYAQLLAKAADTELAAPESDARPAADPYPVEAVGFPVERCDRPRG